MGKDERDDVLSSNIIPKIPSTSSARWMLRVNQHITEARILRNQVLGCWRKDLVFVPDDMLKPRSPRGKATKKGVMSSQKDIKPIPATSGARVCAWGQPAMWQRGIVLKFGLGDVEVRPCFFFLVVMLAEESLAGNDERGWGGYSVRKISCW